MSTTPVTPKSVAAPETLGTEIAAIEKRIGVWLDPTHIVLLILLAIATLGGVYLFESKQVGVAEAKAEIATQAAKVAQEAGASAAVQNAAVQEQSKEVEAAMAAANTQLQAANSQLIAANKQLTNKLLAQQTADAALNPTQQSLRWQQLEPRAEVVPTATGFAIDAAGALATIQDLEELTTDRLVVINLDTEIANLNATIANDATALASEKTAHASDVANDEKQLVAAKATTGQVQADFTLYKKKAHRNILRAFGLGLVVGFFSGHAVGY